MQHRFHFKWMGILLCLSVLKISILEAQTFVESNTFEDTETFENGVPSTWKTINGGSIETTNRRYKQGNRSLIWNWSANSAIEVTDPSLQQVSAEKNSGLSIWLYSENNIGDSIQFLFYDTSGRKACSFYYRINFKGWRGLWIRFRDDMTNHRSYNTLSRMEIVSPKTIPSGHIYFDIVEFAASVSYKRSPSYQYVHPYPYSDQQEVKDDWESWVYANRYPKPTLPLPDRVTNQEQSIFETIQSRFDDWLFGTGTYAHNSHYQNRWDAMQNFIANGVKRFNELDITKDEAGRIYGPGLFTIKAKHSPKIGRGIGEKLCLQLALDYRINGNTDSRDQLLLLFDYMHDQGWAEGSAMETLDHQKLRTAAWAYAVYLMRDALKQSPWENGFSKLDREMSTLRWLCGFNVIFAPLEDLLAVNVDDFRSTTLFRLMYILMMENDDPKKVQYMNHYTQWINRNLRQFEGWADGIKPDGMGYHHRGPYMNAYSNNGMHIMTQILYFLRHTPYDANLESKNNLKKYLLNYRIVNQYYDVPKGVSGRIKGLEKATSMIAPMAYLSQCFEEGRTEATLAAAMLRLWQPQHAPVNDQINKYDMSIMLMHTPGELEAILHVAHEDITPEPEPTGFWMRPYAAMAIFRGTDWFVSVKGTSAYVWDWENGKSENTYGRYDSHGQMEIINNTLPYPSMVHSGHDYEHGWDWCRIPGTTTVNYPLEELKSSTQRVFTPNTFVGGVSHNQTSGVWAMEYQDINYGTGLNFKKSIFFFEPDMMVCLGSDISSYQSLKTESTLFQQVLSSSGGSITVNNTIVDQNEYDYTPRNSATTLLDHLGKGIYVPNDSHLHIQRRYRSSKTMRDKASAGDVITGWFTHDQDHSYEYAILMKTSPDELNAFSSQPTYEVIQQDAKAHIVHYVPANQTGYVLFDSNIPLENGLIASCSEPVMMMVTERDQSHHVSICNPDFGRSKPRDIGDIKQFSDLFGPFSVTPLQVVLRDGWKLKEPVEAVKVLSNNGQNTILEINTHDAQTYEFDLVADTSTSVVPPAETTLIAWPNPTPSVIHFKKSEKSIVYTLNGGQVTSGNNIDHIDLNAFPKGVYILKLINGHGHQTVKITKI